MGRRIWIIAGDKDVTAKVRATAKLNGCPEIAIGIPPVLADKIGVLPCAYEEPEFLSGEEPRNLEAEIDELKARLDDLEVVKI